MALPRITYGSKTIDMTTMPLVVKVEPGPPRSLQTTLTGAVEVISGPRVDVRVYMEWFIASESLATSLQNWAQAARRGEGWALALDSAKTVDTTVVVDAVIGATTFYVDNPSGVTAGQTYKLIDGSNFQLVVVDSVSGDLVTLTAGIDFAIGAGAIFRDQFYFPGILTSDTSPIRILSPSDGLAATWPPVRYAFEPDFTEDTLQETTMLIKALAANESGTDVNTAQPWFPTSGAVAVAANTTYRMRGLLRISRAAGTASHTTGLLFGGTASLTSVAYKAQCNTGDVVTNLAENQTAIEVASVTVVKAASTSATEQISVRIEGIVRINAAGTLIPQFQYSTAPGGAPSVLANTFFELEPEGAGSFVSRGTWS